jgi:hypothetical protein
MSSTAFPKILHVGEKAIAELFDGEVEVTEKLDGSQLGFGVVNGELIVRSKGKEQDLDNPDKMFGVAVQYLKSVFTEGKLIEGAFYYGEYLEKPRHSTLAYDRTPTNNISLFGVMMGGEFKDYDYIKKEAARLGVDAVPLIFKGKLENAEAVLELVKGVSYLGGSQREGVVVKAYRDWEYLGRLHYTVMAGKYVTEEFKEVHQKDWKKLNTGKGKLEVMKAQYKSEARWRKAVQHLRDDGLLTGTPKDIGPLMKEVKADVELEEKENIKNQLWSLFGDDFLREAQTGLPQWYKEQIVKGEADA